MQKQSLELSSIASTHSYPTRKTTNVMDIPDPENQSSARSQISHNEQTSSKNDRSNRSSPSDSQAPKSVAFELLFTQSPQHRARIPMRVQIFPHDTTDSIVTTVKNFYGLYSSPICMTGVSFEDEEGNILIARYENFRNNMTVYVRVISEPMSTAEIYCPSVHASGITALPKPYYSSNIHQTLPLQPTQITNDNVTLPRTTSKNSQRRSISPNRGNQNHVTVKKTRSRLGFKSRGTSTHSSLPENYCNAFNSYCNADGNSGSIVAKTKNEQIGSTEISLDNIVEGGRRKRAKFESSELPLFAPTQMPAATSNSSVSPARRVEHQPPVIYTYPYAQNPFCNPQVQQSPQGLQNGFGQSFMYSTPCAENRNTCGDVTNRQSINSTPSCNSSGIIPTPDPTVGSCMSEEDKDVALQLMRLGELSNISQGRTSASTLDDTFSGKTDTASSTGATSECESENQFYFPPNHKIKREVSPILLPSVMQKVLPHSGDNLPSQDSIEPIYDDGEYEDRRDGTFQPKVKKTGTINFQGKPTPVKLKSQLTAVDKFCNGTSGTKLKSSKAKSQRSSQSRSKKATSGNKPISPASIPSTSSKASNISSALNFSQRIGEDEEDLSSKPRCQRCRKSKKGCDRQRPCQRCKDAGLAADQCISEDEGNGRKGRYGRHMGVPVKKNVSTAGNAYQPSLLTSGNNNCSPSKKRRR